MNVVLVLTVVAFLVMFISLVVVVVVVVELQSRSQAFWAEAGAKLFCQLGILLRSVRTFVQPKTHIRGRKRLRIFLKNTQYKLFFYVDIVLSLNCR